MPRVSRAVLALVLVLVLVTVSQRLTQQTQMTSLLLLLRVP